MAEDNKLDAVIVETASGPAKASNDAGSVEAQKVSDIIEADRYLASKKAASSKRRGLNIAQLVSTGSV